MTAPPARSHILRNINAPTRWSLGSVNDWGEDDAWDSGSDSESKATSKPARARTPSHSAISNGSLASSFVGKSINSHRPDPIPISPPRKDTSTRGTVHRSSPGSNSTSGADRSSTSVNNLAFSYTHVQHPSPSSYPPTATLSSHPESDDIDWQEQERDERERAGWTIVQSDYDGPDEPNMDDNEGEMGGSVVLGDLEPAVFDAEDSDDEPIKEGMDAIKPEADEIVRGEMRIPLLGHVA